MAIRADPRMINKRQYQHAEARNPHNQGTGEE